MKVYYIIIVHIAEAQLSIPDCKTDGKLYKFRVRAININSNNERLTGPWSETGEGNCYSNGQYFIGEENKSYYDHLYCKCSCL